MFDCSKDFRAFHNDQVTLPKKDQDKIRDRRDANRKRVKNGLKSAEKPAPLEFVKQGSYAMKTMVWNPELDFDIDDGVYFRKEDLVGPQGGQMSSRQSREMVRDAVDDGSFKTAPEVRTNCVRVFYDAGIHVDLPVYRKVIEENIFGNEEVYYELAAGSTWTRSDARDVNDWYEDKRRISADGTQMRRVGADFKPGEAVRQVNAMQARATEADLGECGNERARDNWEPLARLASILGGPWPDRVRAAYAVKEGQGNDSDGDDAALMLLADLHGWFDDHPATQHVTSADMVQHLIGLPDRPWSTWAKGAFPITPRAAALKMKAFGVRPRKVRTVSGTARAYNKADVVDAFTRYVLPSLTNRGTTSGTV